jgi:hypothetical protein
MDRECRMYGWRKEMHIGFWWGNPKVRGHLETLSLNERIILKQIINLVERLNWTNVGQDTDK